MKTAVLIAGATDVRPFFTEALGAQVNVVLLEPPAEPDRAHFDALFETWLRLVDIVVVDAVSLGATTRWALESLAKAALADHQAVIVRLTADQLYTVRQRKPEQAQDELAADCQRDKQFNGAFDLAGRTDESTNILATPSVEQEW